MSKEEAKQLIKNCSGLNNALKNDVLNELNKIQGSEVSEEELK